MDSITQKSMDSFYNRAANHKVKKDGELEEYRSAMLRSYTLAMSCCTSILADKNILLSYLDFCQENGYHPNDSAMLLEKHIYAKAMEAVGYKIEEIT